MPGARRHHRRTRAVLVAVAFTLVACIPDTRPATCDAAATTIELHLTATALAPNNPAACRDQEVTMIITPEVDGIVHIHGYDAEVPATEVRSGEELTLDFTAVRSGQFPIELHPADDPTGIGIGLFTVHEP